MTLELIVTEHDGDYRALEDVVRRAEPDSHTSAADMAEWDALQRAAGRVSLRVLARSDGEPVGMAFAAHPPELAETDWWGSVRVVPDRRGEGIGRALLARVEELAAEKGAIRLLGSVAEDDERAVRFATAAGFVEFDREWRSTLDLESFDPDVWLRLVDEVLDSGIRIVTMAELLAEDGDAVERIHRLWVALDAEVPTPLAIGALPLADFRAQFVVSDQALPDGFLVAVEGGELVGLTQPLAVRSDPTAIEQELTGVLPSHRGRHIATALKAEAARWAKANGYTSIRTYNAMSNDPMLAVNTKLGFVRDRAMIEMEKRFGQR